MKKVLGACLLPLLLIAACGGDDRTEATPTAAPAQVTVAVTPTEEATVAEATPTIAMTETAGLTETTGLTGVASMTGTTRLTVTTGVGRASGITGTTGLSGTNSMTETSGVQQAPHQLLRAAQLKDYKVENAAGDNLGSVDDLVLNLENGQILLVTLQYGGFLDIGDKTFPIPLSAFRFDRETITIPGGPGVVITNTNGVTTGNGLTNTTSGIGNVSVTNTNGVTSAAGLTDTVAVGTRLILDIPEETFKNAPGIAENMNLTDPKTIGDIEKFYRDLGEDVIGRPIAQTNLAELTGRVVKLSDLNGANVQNSAGEGVGEINDILLDLRAAHVEYFILSFGGFLGIGDKLYAVPMSAFKVIPTSADVANGHPTLVLDVTEDQLKQAPVFDDTQLNSSNWDTQARQFWSKMR